jgi:hypothetical protein
MSDYGIGGIAAGWAKRQREFQEQDEAAEKQRRQSILSAWERVYGDPDATPEAKDMAISAILDISQTPRGKKLNKKWEAIPATAMQRVQRPDQTVTEVPQRAESAPAPQTLMGLMQQGAQQKPMNSLLGLAGLLGGGGQNMMQPTQNPTVEEPPQNMMLRTGQPTQGGPLPMKPSLPSPETAFPAPVSRTIPGGIEEREVPFKLRYDPGEKTAIEAHRHGEIAAAKHNAKVQSDVQKMTAAAVEVDRMIDQGMDPAAIATAMGGSVGSAYLRAQNPGDPTDGANASKLMYLDALQEFAEARGKTVQQLTGRERAQAAHQYAQRRAAAMGGGGYAGRAAMGGESPEQVLLPDGRVVYVPRSQVWGQAAPVTIFGPGGMPMTGGMQGYSRQQPPAVPNETQAQLFAWTNTLSKLDTLEQLIPSLENEFLSFGPVGGRIGEFLYQFVGGRALSDEQKSAIGLMRDLLSGRAFEEGGKQLTWTEKEEFFWLTPRNTDTIEQAMIKMRNLRMLSQRRVQNRLAVMPVQQFRQLPAEMQKNAPRWLRQEILSQRPETRQQSLGMLEQSPNREAMELPWQSWEHAGRLENRAAATTAAPTAPPPPPNKGSGTQQLGPRLPDKPQKDISQMSDEEVFAHVRALLGGQ